MDRADRGTRFCSQSCKLNVCKLGHREGRREKYSTDYLALHKVAYNDYPYVYVYFANEKLITAHSQES